AGVQEALELRRRAVKDRADRTEDDEPEQYREQALMVAQQHHLDHQAVTRRSGTRILSLQELAHVRMWSVCLAGLERTQVILDLLVRPAPADAGDQDGDRE